MGLKIVIGQKDGKTVQREIDDAVAKPLLGRKIGDTFKGEVLGLTGYEFQIMGGSDNCGFPMRSDVPGFARKAILSVEGVGQHKTAPGIKHRKTVCGQIVSPRVVQLNVKVLKEGAEKLVGTPKEEKK
jgi:small subunit ribosomal protein S6e